MDESKEERRGQIAHVNRDASDNRLENLVYLCLDHHDAYDGKTSQSKGFLPAEVRKYRDALLRQFPDPDAAEGILVSEPDDETTEYSLVRRKSPNLAFTERPWRFPLWLVANEPELIAYKVPSGADGMCLIERINLPDGRIVVACIEVAGTPGQSITNAVEHICFQVCERFEIPANRLVWLEHYDFYEPQTWNWVTFAQTPPEGPFKNPEWTEMTDHLWAELRLRPKKKLRTWMGHYRSKLIKRFNWPTEGLF